ncbi:2-hydroxychromene-2-carboxylate isomerase [Amycolatopsis minnesotensis]|uniref:2-hydroxychromene-2-carboxylate isomerase n=1 Tax=Amycolatopsis minnesotensis TaxID=337894 RepID=A0ABP5BYC8_9PSEU
MSPRKPRGRPRLYFSFRSPYSWLAVQRLRAAVDDAATAFEWIPYWDPDERTAAAVTGAGAEIHYTQMSRAKHRYLLLDTKRVATAAGLPMAWPIDVDPWWELPHLGWIFASGQGRGLAFYDEVVAARWHRGEDVCTPEVLRGVAERAGVDPDLAVAAPDRPEIREAGVKALVSAYHDDVFGIPYLLWGRDRFWGLDRVDGFLAIWRTAAEEGLPAVPGPRMESDAYDTDTAGGCG